MGSNNLCFKPTSSILKDKTRICDEKIYDWYMIPNYHLGNSYRKGADGKCYEPCSGTEYVPLVTEDPVTKDKWNVEFSDSSIKTDGSRCVHIKDYFNGEYDPNKNKANAGLEHCPIAVIKRLSTYTEGIKDELKSAAQKSLDELEDQLPSSTKVRMNSIIAGEASRVALDSKKNLKNINAGAPKMKIACGRLVDDEEIGNLHAICKSLKETPSKFYTNWRADTPNASDQTLRTRRTVMEQACHEVFCNNPQNAMIAGGASVCFTPTSVSQADLDEHNSAVNLVAATISNRSSDGNTPVVLSSGKAPIMDPITSSFVKNSIRSVVGVFFILYLILFFFMCIKFYKWILS